VSEELINEHNLLNNRNISDINETAFIELYNLQSVTWLQIDTQCPLSVCTKCKECLVCEIQQSVKFSTS